MSPITSSTDVLTRIAVALERIANALEGGSGHGIPVETGNTYETVHGTRYTVESGGILPYRPADYG